MPTHKNISSKSELIIQKIEESKRGNEAPDLNTSNLPRSILAFDNLDIESIKPRKSEIEYASVKLKVDLFERIKHAAEANGIKQPGKFISLILEAYLAQAEKK
ncbi:MAG: hypothetical protein NZM38_10250 [Cytophagales bacterium]|nr:hypothetical protein [Cytophagales bacterium]MDW8385135.1 hypothetical protein [Flammeovirgaceae bacterium]